MVLCNSPFLTFHCHGLNSADLWSRQLTGQIKEETVLSECASTLILQVSVPNYDKDRVLSNTSLQNPPEEFTWAEIYQL